jgi:hypothetical protein
MYVCIHGCRGRVLIKNSVQVWLNRYVCTRTCIHIIILCICICILSFNIRAYIQHIHIDTHRHMHALSLAFIHTRNNTRWAYVCMYVRMYICIYVPLLSYRERIYACMYLCIHTEIHTYIHAYIHTHIYAYLQEHAVRLKLASYFSDYGFDHPIWRVAGELPFHLLKVKQVVLMHDIYMYIYIHIYIVLKHNICIYIYNMRSRASFHGCTRIYIRTYILLLKQACTQMQSWHLLHECVASVPMFMALWTYPEGIADLTRYVKLSHTTLMGCVYAIRYVHASIHMHELNQMHAELAYCYTRACVFVIRRFCTQMHMNMLCSYSIHAHGICYAHIAYMHMNMLCSYSIHAHGYAMLI